jgi:signal transduction histidine kinase
MSFAAYLAHEFRTPLATQRAVLELALSDRTADVAAWRAVGESLLRACEHEERLLDACLALARGQDGSKRREPLDLARVAFDVLRAHDRGELESVVALDPAWTAGDPDLLERLTANLVSNAIRHNVVHGRIEVATRCVFGRAVLSVANTGPLIPDGELERLFQPFERLESGPRSFGDGIGLGLAIVDAIAGAHEAVVTACVRAGGGLGIDVAFPALDRREATSCVAAAR